MRTSRLEAFSDGVLAIIITIMVLELHEPDGNDLSHLLHSSGTGLLSYLLSFVYIGIYWTNHHHMFQVTARVTGGILWANLALLFTLSLFQFTTQWVDTSGFARTPVVVYGLSLLSAGVAYFALQWVIIRSQGPGSPLRKAIGSDFKGKMSPVGYIAGCVAALVGGAGTGWNRPGIWFAVACYVAVAAMWIIPDRRIERKIETIVAAEERTSEGDPEADPNREL
jgi:uncharacterized membrane protein